MSEEYSLAKSEKLVGQLYPILVAKDGEIIDGFHREDANENWKRLRLNHVDTEEKKLIARLVSNFHRRQVTREEKEEWINGLARIYKKQGLKLRTSGSQNTVLGKLVEVTGLSEKTIRKYLHEEYKQGERKRKEHPYRRPASEAIVGHISDKDYGKRLVERHREEVKQELLKDKEFHKEVLAEEKPRIEAEVKEKLLHDRQFQRVVLEELSKPRILTATEPCPTGVCELPSIMDAGEQVDIRAEAIEKFWQHNPNCLCKKCSHYGKCGVIR